MNIESPEVRKTAKESKQIFEGFTYEHEDY